MPNDSKFEILAIEHVHNSEILHFTNSNQQDEQRQSASQPAKYAGAVAKFQKNGPANSFPRP